MCFTGSTLAFYCVRQSGCSASDTSASSIFLPGHTSFQTPSAECIILNLPPFRTLLGSSYLHVSPAELKQLLQNLLEVWIKWKQKQDSRCISHIHLYISINFISGDNDIQMKFMEFWFCLQWFLNMNMNFEQKELISVLLLQKMVISALGQGICYNSYNSTKLYIR